MNDECPSCNEYREKGYPFCGVCGRSLEQTEQDPETDAYQNPPPQEFTPQPEPPRFGFLELILLAACVFVLFVAVFEAITLAVHFSDITVLLSDKTLGFIVIVPFPYSIFSLGGLALQAYWVFVAATIVLCVVITIQKFIFGFRTPAGNSDPGAAENTAAFWICVSVTAMYLINFIIVLITEASGSEIGVPDFGSKLEQMFLVADASLWEEIIARMLYIGVPVAVISLLVAKPNARLVDSLKCLLGGFGMSKTAVILIILSGMVFGLAHYPGWENQLWKVFATTLMGMFLGYIFVRFGLYASILLHFINNYLTSFDWMGVGALLFIVVIIFMIVGAIALIYLMKKSLKLPSTIMSLPSFKNGYIKDEEQSQL